MSSLADQSSPATKAGRPGGGRIDPTAVVIIVVGLLCFVTLFFGWNGLCLPLGPLGRLGGRSVCSTEIGVVSGWAGFGVVAGLAVVTLIVWEVVSLTGGLALSSRAVERQVAAGLAAVIGVFTLLRVLTQLTGLTAYAWIGLALAAAICVLAVARWLRYRLSPDPAGPTGPADLTGAPDLTGALTLPARRPYRRADPTGPQTLPARRPYRPADPTGPVDPYQPHWPIPHLTPQTPHRAAPASRPRPAPTHILTTSRRNRRPTWAALRSSVSAKS